MFDVYYVDLGNGVKVNSDKTVRKAVGKNGSFFLLATSLCPGGIRSHDP
jgi:hypothetical protein